MRELARDVFGVYFATGRDCGAADASSRFGQMKGRGLRTKVNGTMPYARAYLKDLGLPRPVVTFALFVEASFRGIAQVYFQNNPLSGILILAGMFVQSTRVAVHGVVAVVSGNLAGMLMGFDKSLLACGLFGYNSFLVGLALATFFSTERHEGYYWPVAIGATLFAYLSSVLFVMLGKVLSPYKTPPFTLPFNISTTLFLLAMGGLNNVNMVQVPSYPQPMSKITAEDFFAGSIRGVGQVYLANDIIPGALVLAGIALCSRISALAALLGSAVGAGAAALIGCDREAIANGVYGFNPSLTLVAVLMFYVPSFGSLAVGIAASVVTVFVQLALETSLEPYGLPFMTLPFCLAALAFVVIQGTTANVISVPLSSMTTPEDHLKRVSRLSQGFDLLYGAIRSSSYKDERSKLSKLSCYNSTRKGSEKMSSVLREYDEVTHGKEEGFRARILKAQQSFRMSFATKNSLSEGAENDMYERMFHHIDADITYQIGKDQFKLFLQSVGFQSEVGLSLACKAFQIMDLDKSGIMDIEKFTAFAKISRHMPEIRRSVIKFMDFVDIDGDRSIKISELDGARSYLGLSPMPEEDRQKLVSLCDIFKFDEFVNFVTIFKLKTIVKEYQIKRTKGYNLDDSIRSSLW